MTATVRFDKWENTASTKSVTMDQIAGGTGLVPIVPTSVSVSSGSASFNAKGAITLSGAASITLNNVFTSEFENYKIIYAGTASTIIGLFNKFTLNGSDVSGNYYYRYSNTGSTAMSVTNLVNTSYCEIGATANGLGGMFEANIFKPNLPVYTQMLSFASYDDGVGMAVRNIGACHAAGIADGIRIYCSGTFSGTIQVFGYND